MIVMWLCLCFIIFFVTAIFGIFVIGIIVIYFLYKRKPSESIDNSLGGDINNNFNYDVPKSDIMASLTNNQNINSNNSSDRSMRRASSDRSMRASSDRSMGRVSSDRSMGSPNMNNVISRLNKYANI